MTNDQCMAQLVFFCQIIYQKWSNNSCMVSKSVPPRKGAWGKNPERGVSLNLKPETRPWGMPVARVVETFQAKGLHPKTKPV